MNYFFDPITGAVVQSPEPPSAPRIATEVRSQPWAGPTNFYERFLAGPWTPSGLFGQRNLRGGGPVPTLPDNLLAEDPQPSPPALTDAALASSTTDPPAETQTDAAVTTQPAQPPPAVQPPPAAAPTTTVQPPVTPPATPPAAPASNPVTAALGAPGQPAVDPNARLRDLTARFEVGGVRGDPYFTPNGAGSSAFGRYQITQGHYETLRTMFPQEGLPDWDEFRRNPAVQDRAMDLSTRYYQNEAQRRGFEYTDATHLGMHFLGVEGFDRMGRALRENPSAPVSSVVSQRAIEQNGNIFRDERGNVRTVQDAYNQMQARFNGQREGALTAANGGTADQRTNAAATNPTATTPQEANPYRERLQQLLTSIEGERNSRPDTGELLLRMGAGILSGRDLMDGMGRGGASVAELMQQTRQDNARRDQTLVGGFQGLVNDRRFQQQQRDAFNAPRNVRIIPRDGSPAFDVIGRIVNGQTLVRHPTTNQEVPVNEAFPNASATFAGMGDRPMFEQQAGGIPGAVRVTRIGGEDIPVFEFNRESDGKAFGFGLNAITAHQRLIQLEQSGNFNPTSVTAAIAQYLSDRGPIDIRRVGSLFTSPQDQAYATAVLQYVNAVARRESGAQINEGEWARYSAMFAARPGESPEAVGERAQTRMNNIVPLIGQSGPAAIYLGQVANNERRLPRAYSDPGVVDQSFGLNQPRPQAQPQGGGTNEPRILEQLNPSTINALRDDERVRVRINGQLQEITGAQLKAELARRQGQQR
ncbi:hypothetical protein UFOVP730_4 [uncultured Caudovirales phage]|uniref:Uncharacterized protein n=1 Tax=uncultured Caudovirales phage TaxID=2100421 RepID=A0A6J5NTK5_9CAUD|nr:hypothetical protein UFOVP730_4 [uncultured Caudovirales phage]